MEYAGKGTTALGVLGTTLGGIGTAAALNGGNLLGSLFGGGNGYTRQEAEKDAQIARLETEVKLRDANVYTRDYVDGELKDIRKELREIAVYQATNTATIGCLSGQVNALQNVLNSITQVRVPNGAICPGWGDVTVSVTPATTATAGA